MFTRVRERAKRAEKELTYFEWSLDYEHPDDVPEGQTFAWDQKSTYVRNPPFFEV